MHAPVFPYKAWILLPSFSLKQIELARPFKYFPDAHHETASGRSYHLSELFLTKAEAIKHGRDRINMGMAEVRTREAKLLKKLAALEKADFQDRKTTVC